MARSALRRLLGRDEVREFRAPRLEVVPAAAELERRKGPGRVLAAEACEVLPAAGQAERELLHAGSVADQHQRLDVVLDRSQSLLGGGVVLTLDTHGYPLARDRPGTPRGEPLRGHVTRDATSVPNHGRISKQATFGRRDSGHWPLWQMTDGPILDSYKQRRVEHGLQSRQACRCRVRVDRPPTPFRCD